MTLHARRPDADAATPVRVAQPGVPPTRGLRDAVLAEVRGLIAGRGLQGGLSRQRLMELAGESLAAGGHPQAWQGFAAVLLNNELSRDRLAAVPVQKRLLLLPRCLRNHAVCPAKMDELGLLCQRCGQCSLDEIQRRAHEEGYVTLIAEGATVVAGLIESGRVQAIIGIGCLSMLEQVFPLVQLSAVPALALPLLYDGCMETDLDLEWLWEVLALRGTAVADEMDLSALRTEVEQWFAPDSLAATLGSPRDATQRLAHEWLARGGKRWRPVMATCVSRSLNEHAPQAALQQLTVAVECFHKASLVHDDIEDGDDERYGQQSLHRQQGVPIALNVGDYLLGEGYRLLAGLPVEGDDRRVEMLQVAADAHRRLCIGQGAELVWMRRPRPLGVEEVLEIFRHKTAPAFEVALRLGAIHAGANGQVGQVLAAYSDELGIAYQIRDDLEDFFCPEGSDLGARRPSLLLALAMDLATPEESARIARFWLTDDTDAQTLWPRDDAEAQAARERPGPTCGDAALARPGTASVRRLVVRLGARERAMELLAASRDRAQAALNELDSPRLKTLLGRIMSRIFADIHALADPAAR